MRNGPITFVGKSSDPAGEDAMMACRWTEFKFTHSISKVDRSNSHLVVDVLPS